jgi:hypothetical protein
MEALMRYTMLGAVFLVSAAAFAAAPNKPIWLWTPAERVGVRMEHFAPVRSGPRVQSLSVGAADDRFVIDGRTNPELLMPDELFNALLQGLSDETQVRAVNRQTLAPGIRGFGFDEASFWSTLDQATSHYRDQVRSRNRAEWSKASAPALQQLDIKLCQSRAAALESVRHVFRQEGFDRFLYTVVAPTISITTAAVRETPEHLLSVEDGCR